MRGTDDRQARPDRPEGGPPSGRTPNRSPGPARGGNPGWLLYRLSVASILLLAAPVLLARRGRHYLPTLRGRLGLDTGAPDGSPTAEGGATGGLWIHAVSVGEVGVAATLARRLPAAEPGLVTTVTPTGQERARAAFGDRARIAYLPFDLAAPLGRFFRRFAPGALVLVEGDYWPLTLREADRRGLPVAVVNGRVGDRSFRRMERLGSLPGTLGRLGRRLLRLLFDPVDRFGVQTREDRRRLLALGVAPERVRVTGNLKYETPEPPLRPELERLVRRLADGRPILVAGSTMAGEDAQVLDAFVRIGGGARALLVLAPRHPERWDEAAERVAEAGLDGLRRSTIEVEPEAQPESDSPVDGVSGPRERSPRPDVLLLDTLGELAGLYRLASGAFIGGTLVATGGHNPLEAALWAAPVAVGPSMENFRQVADEFDRLEAWARVTDPAELAAAWHRWLEHPAEGARVGARGRDLIERNRGALERTLKMLVDLGITPETGA